jgi:hypothetical protein
LALHIAGLIDRQEMHHVLGAVDLSEVCPKAKRTNYSTLVAMT